jgi:hypothetical protein
MMEDAENRPFDGSPALTDTVAFGPRAAVAAGAPLDSLEVRGVIVDLDDVHRVEGVRVFRWSEEPVAGLEQPIVFDAAFKVEYVQRHGGAWVASDVPTGVKRVMATVDHRMSEGPIRATRIYPDLR